MSDESIQQAVAHRHGVGAMSLIVGAIPSSLPLSPRHPCGPHCHLYSTPVIVEVVMWLLAPVPLSQMVSWGLGPSMSTWSETGSGWMPYYR